jgi:branched-chain amino acid transport system ATP-binding protein
MLEIRDLFASYGSAEAVRGVSLDVAEGSVVGIIGPNGAGKSTLARAVAGVHRAVAGSVRLGGRELAGSTTVSVARAGLTLVPQGRRLFGSLTVAEHLVLARRHARAGAMTADELLELLPQLSGRLKVRAGSLSGGEQQMLAIARAVLLGPAVVIMDEPTEGLSPAVVSVVAGLLGELRSRGVGVLLLEQRGAFPDKVADVVLTMDRGALGAAAPVPMPETVGEVPA